MTIKSRSRQTRRCRVSRLRTISTVRRALNTWCYVYPQHSFTWEVPQFDDCGDLARTVKELISRDFDPSVPEEAVMAFRSIKKLLPSSCKCQEGGMLERLVEGFLRPSAPLPSGYLAFARNICEEVFPIGWDETYRSHCYSTSPPLGATLEHSRSSGGGLMTAFNQPEYLDAVLRGDFSEINTEAKLLVVQSAGKPRPLSKFSSETLLLKPLHKALYDQVSAQSWCLRGTPTAASLRKAGFHRNRGILVSGDYASATDNLPLSVASAILDVALERSSRIPQRIGAAAKSILRPLLWLGNELFTPEKGQMMGSLTSFPLLCLQNYIAFRWSLETFRPDCYPRFLAKDCPLLINGDDILFQADDPRFYKHWVKVVGEVGLTVEVTKTSVSGQYGSLNSTLFRWQDRYLRVVPTLRFGMLRRSEFPHSLSSSFSDFVRGQPSSVRYLAARSWFEWHVGELRAAQLSLGELGFVGRLAFRVADQIGLLKNQRRRIESGISLDAQLPPLPSFHNIILDRDDVYEVPSLREDEEVLMSRQTSAWKWNLANKFEASGNKIRFWLRLSVAAFPYRCPAKKACYWSQLTPVDWRAEYRRWYFTPRPKPVRTRLFWHALDRLPEYGEENGALGLLESGDDPVVFLSEGTTPYLSCFRRGLLGVLAKKR